MVTCALLWVALSLVRTPGDRSERIVAACGHDHAPARPLARVGLGRRREGDRCRLLARLQLTQTLSVVSSTPVVAVVGNHRTPTHPLSRPALVAKSAGDHFRSSSPEIGGTPSDSGQSRERTKKEMRFRGLASGIRAESERFCTLVVSRVALKRAGFHLKTPQSRCGMASGDPRTRVRGCVPAVASAWSRVPTPALACGVLAARFRYRTPRRGSCISRPSRGSYNDGSWKAGKGRERCQPSSASARSTT